MKTWPIPALLSAALLAPTTAAAQQSDWTYRGTLYGWTAGMDVTAQTPQGTVDGDMSIGDVLDNLNMAFMASVEARNGPWSLVGDFVYANIEAENAVPPNGAGFNSAILDTKLTVGSAYGMYRVHSEQAFSVDLGLGLRWADMDVKSTLNPGASQFDSSDSWTDAVAAVRVRSMFNEKWYGSFLADVGTGFNGDSSSWQALAAVGYKFNPTWSIEAGYRYLSISNTISGNDVDLDLSGPMIGVSARF